jgi:hypothetical protein
MNRGSGMKLEILAEIRWCEKRAGIDPTIGRSRMLFQLHAGRDSGRKSRFQREVRILRWRHVPCILRKAESNLRLRPSRLLRLTIDVWP